MVLPATTKGLFLFPQTSQAVGSMLVSEVAFPCLDNITNVNVFGRRGVVVGTLTFAQPILLESRVTSNRRRDFVFSPVV